MTRGGRDKNRDEPERKCIVSGETGSKAGLVRFVIGPEAMLVPDINNRLPGRGIYVSSDRAAMEKAGVTPQQTAMLGDKLLTDVLGANRSGVLAVMVEPMGGPKGVWNHILHGLQKPFKARCKERK